jgi:hypothetical protein
MLRYPVTNGASDTGTSVSTAPEVMMTGPAEAAVFGAEESMTCALDEGKGGSSPAKLAVATLTTVTVTSGDVQYVLTDAPTASVTPVVSQAGANGSLTVTFASGVSPLLVTVTFQYAASP